MRTLLIIAFLGSWFSAYASNPRTTSQLCQDSSPSPEALLPLTEQSQRCEVFCQSQAIELIGDCKADEASPLVNCGAFVGAAGLAYMQKFNPVTTARLASSMGRFLPQIAKVAGVMAVPLSSYMVIDLFSKALSDDELCFQNVEGKRSYLVALKERGQRLSQELKDHLDPKNLAQLKVPEAYLEDSFLKKLTCGELREITRQQKIKQDRLIGPLLAQKKISADPRKRPSLSEEETALMTELSDHLPCLSTARRLKVICTLGAVALGLKTFSEVNFKNASVIQSPFRRNLSESVLQRDLSLSERQAIEAAHLIGRGQKGADGTLAKVGNYTPAQVRQKMRTLKDANFSARERRLLMEKSVVGDSEHIEELISLEEKLIVMERQAWRIGANQQTQNIQKLKTELDELLDADPKSISIKMSELRRRIDSESSVLTSGTTISSTTARSPSLDHLFENPNLLRGEQKIPLTSVSNREIYAQFNERALDGLLKAEKNISKKLVESFRSGVSQGKVDPTKVKLLSDLPSGSQGRPFEVRIIGRGHQRLIGCYQEGVYKILVYDPQAPQTGPSFSDRYKNICR